MICPRCSESMIILEYQETEIDYCLSCGGIWLDQGELEWLLKWEKRKLDLSAVSHFTKSKRRCPRCRKKMVKGDFPDTTIEVDICRRDGGMWLDQGEILQIAKDQCEEQTFKNISRFFSELFTDKTEIKEE
jgi:Zn-finger nucleic acid-binding protein